MLRQMITKGDRDSAWELFNSARASGAADMLHWSMMLKLCDTSAAARRMMDEMVEAGFKLTDVTYEILVRQLMLEGNFKGARVVVVTEMPAVGIVPSKLTKSLFNQPKTRKWSMMRSDHLQNLIETNAVEQAREFFELIKASGAANVFQWTLMQRLCDTSTERRSMMQEMAEAGVQQNVVTYNKLAQQLMIEGKYDEARCVVETEMPAAGITPNDSILALFEKTEEAWSRTRTTHLLHLVKKGTPKARQAAHEFFQGLKANGAANEYQWTLMQRLCNTSMQRRSMMDEMVEAGMDPPVATYSTRVQHLMVEGKYEEARGVVETEMPSAGVVPNDRIRELFGRPAEVWSKMRTQQLVDLLSTNTPETRQQAQALFEVLKINGAANEYQWTLMQRLCNTSTEQRVMMREMVKSGVQPTVSTYNQLVQQLMVEGKCEEARAVVEIDFPVSGMTPDDRTQELFDRPEEAWSKIRTRYLLDLLTASTPEAKQMAQQFFEVLKATEAVSLFQCPDLDATAL